ADAAIACGVGLFDLLLHAILHLIFAMLAAVAHTLPCSCCLCHAPSVRHVNCRANRKVRPTAKLRRQVAGWAPQPGLALHPGLRRRRELVKFEPYAYRPSQHSAATIEKHGRSWVRARGGKCPMQA